MLLLLITEHTLNLEWSQSTEFGTPNNPLQPAPHIICAVTDLFDDINTSLIQYHWKETSLLNWVNYVSVKVMGPISAVILKLEGEAPLSVVTWI